MTTQTVTIVTVDVELTIENHYELYDTEITVVNATIPPPPAGAEPGDEAYDEWEYDEIFCHTGTGREEGDSSYFVKVTKSSRPDLIPVGTEYEFGL